jgi:epoxyqueuosine reductase QueG
VLIERIMPYAAGRMREKLRDTPYTHAIIALFEGKVAIGQGGGDYSANKALLTKDCERLRAQYPDYQFRASSTAWPLPAVQAARLAGLGKMCLNGLLWAEGLGFALTIGAVFTDMPLPDGREDGGICPMCMECVKKCPTQAITYNSGVRAFEREMCLSHQRQKCGVPLEREGYYGCDICQDCCPLTRP